MASTQSPNNISEVFAVVQQISSLINKDHVQAIADKAKGLDAEDNQLIVDLLAMALEKSHHILKNADRVFLLLKKIASSASIVARNRIINSEHITSDEDQPPGPHRTLGDQPGHVKVVSRGSKNISQALNEDLVAWAHFTHLNILPVYGVFLEGNDGPIYLVSPQMMSGHNIVGHAKSLAQTDRMLLISDVIEGLCYLHSLHVVHGALNPQNVILSNDGRALITGFRASSESQDSESYSGRYSAPEMLEDDACPTTASDIWSLGCLIYEVLSGKAPFYQIRQEVKVGIAIAAGKKPIRPSQGETGVEEIDDTIWRPTFTCWEFEANDRPTCWQLQKAIASMVVRDNRPVPKPTVKRAEESFFEFDHARSLLMQLVESSDLTMSPPSKIPEHLQQPLSGLIDSVAKAETVAVAAQKLSRDDTQILIDVLDLMIEENPSKVNYSHPPISLSRKVMASTHIFPQCYKINHIRYDPIPVVEDHTGKVYKGRDLDVCVALITAPSHVASIFELFALWAHSSHPSVLPLYGVFHEPANELPQFCLVLPYMKNELLRDYAPRLPQHARLPLILDAINALVFLDELGIVCNNAKGDGFVISEGRALIDAYVAPGLLTSPTNNRIPELYAVRFYSPERAAAGETNEMATVWSFGCLVYEVLSGKPPYHQYTEESELKSAVIRGEAPRRPSSMNDGDIEEIGDQFWDLIMGCCVLDPADRFSLSEIQELIVDMDIQDNRPKGASLPGVEALALRSPPDINWDGVKLLLDKLQVELLRTPLSKLIQNPTKDVATAVVNLASEDVRTLVDFLDLALKNHITLSDERNRVLALLSRVTTLTHIFPRRYELKGIKYSSLPIAEGGYGTVHRGISDPNICVKVMTKVDPTALMGFIKELILWAHASHPNVLPFYGVFLSESKRICLVSPFMIKGNLHDYAPRLAQKDRIPLLHDVIKGLVYLHGLGVVHTDLKGENVLISDEGHGLISDFGASHVITATAKGGATTASVASTLRFTAPEIVLDRQTRPAQECDIWSFGCLCYEVLSRKLPYFEYRLEAQIYAALARKQLPKRPSSADDTIDDDEGWDGSDERDWDEIDDSGWNLITKCCTPEPEDRPKASRIQELIVDLKMWDVRPEAKDVSDAHLLSSLRSLSEVNLNRAGELLNELQSRLLAHMALQHPTGDVISAVTRLDLEHDDADTLIEFWDLVLNHQLFTSNKRNHALALLSALIASIQLGPYSYSLTSPIAFNRQSIGKGCFGTAHRGIDTNICIKASNLERLNPGFLAQRRKALAPLAYSSHPNILPFYGMFWTRNMVCYVYPFMKNGNLQNYTLRLPQKSRLLLICDVVEAVMYLNNIGIVHGNLKGENILISDEGRALVADFRPYHANLVAAEDAPTGSYITSTLRFTAPELVKASETLPTAKSDIWSIGCLIYLVLSRKVPFHQYSKDAEIRASLSRGEPPTRPISTDNRADEVDDQSWDLITKCCAPEPDDRFTFSDIQKWLARLGIQDNRPPATPLSSDEILKLRQTHYGVDVTRAGEVMARVIAELPPISQDGEEEARGQSILNQSTSPIIGSTLS